MFQNCTGNKIYLEYSNQIIAAITSLSLFFGNPFAVNENCEFNMTTGYMYTMEMKTEFRHGLKADFNYRHQMLSFIKWP